MDGKRGMSFDGKVASKKIRHSKCKIAIKRFRGMDKHQPLVT